MATLLVLGEIYAALQSGSLSLAMMGARAVLNTSITKTVGDYGNFPANLKAVQEAGHLSKKNCDYLEVAFDAGSASAHRSHRYGSFR